MNTNNSTVDAGKPTQDELLAELARLKAENERLTAEASSNKRGLTLQVSTKGAMSIYGVGRWPVTLYKSQAARVFEPKMVERIHKFLADNDAKLKEKPVKE